MTTQEMRALSEVMPLEEALAIKVVTINKKIVDQLPEYGIRHDEITEEFFKSFTVIGAYNHYIVVRMNGTNELRKYLNRDFRMMSNDLNINQQWIEDIEQQHRIFAK